MPPVVCPRSFAANPIYSSTVVTSSLARVEPVRREHSMSTTRLVAIGNTHPTAPLQRSGSRENWVHVSGEPDRRTGSEWKRRRGSVWRGFDTAEAAGVPDYACMWGIIFSSFEGKQAIICDSCRRPAGGDPFAHAPTTLCYIKNGFGESFTRRGRRLQGDAKRRNKCLHPVLVNDFVSFLSRLPLSVDEQTVSSMIS